MRHRPGPLLLIAFACGAFAGLVVGMACMLFGVGGRGPESGMWIILMPFVGAAIGLIAGTASLALSAVHPTALYVVLVTAVTIGATIGLGYVVLDGFNLGGVELGFAALVGATCAHFYRRFLTSSARLAGVSRKAEFSKRGQ